MTVEMLSQEDIVSLLRVIRESDRVQPGLPAAALDTLVHHFQPLVLRTAKTYAHVAFEDAIQEGYLALLDAIHSYDESLGVPFAGYVTVKVRGDVRTAMRRLWRYEERVTYPGDSRSGRGELHGAGDQADLWDKPERSNGATATGAGQPGNWDDYDTADLHMTIDSVNLSPRERMAIYSMLAGETCAMLAVKTGVSTETVKTWRKRALHKLRAALGGEV